MGWFRRKSAARGADALVALRAEVAALTQRLDTTEQSRATLEQRLAALDTVDGRMQVVDQLAAQLAELSSKAAATTNGPSEVGQLAERLATLDHALRATTEQLATVEQRITSISIELANQINELGNDVDALASAPAAAPGQMSNDALDSLRTAQVRLASEQARYEIAFRQDLAALAEQIRRHGTA